MAQRTQDRTESVMNLIFEGGSSSGNIVVHIGVKRNLKARFQTKRSRCLEPIILILPQSPFLIYRFARTNYLASWWCWECLHTCYYRGQTRIWSSNNVCKIKRGLYFMLFKRPVVGACQVYCCSDAGRVTSRCVTALMSGFTLFWRKMTQGAFLSRREMLHLSQTTQVQSSATSHTVTRRSKPSKHTLKERLLPVSTSPR